LKKIVFSEKTLELREIWQNSEQALNLKPGVRLWSFKVAALHSWTGKKL